VEEAACASGGGRTTPAAGAPWLWGPLFGTGGLVGVTTPGNARRPSTGVSGALRYVCGEVCGVTRGDLVTAGQWRW